MSMKVSRTSSTTASSASRASKTSSSKSSSASKSSSKTNKSKSSSASKNSSKTSSSISSSASKSSSNTAALSKSVTKESSSKDSSATQTNSGNIDGLSAVYTGALIGSKIATRSISNASNNSSNTNLPLQSLISGAMCGAATATQDTTQRITKYITDAPVIYTRQGLDSTVGSSTPTGYIPGMPSSEYEKYKKSLPPEFNGKTPAINKMLKNIYKDKTLKLSDDKKTAMLVAAEKLLNKGYKAKFVAGVLGNIMNEGEAGLFESSYYKNPDRKPPYLICMENDFDYDTKFSGKTISEVGIVEAVKLQKQSSKKQHTITVDGEKKKVQDQFGFGMCQFTGSRTTDVLDAYKKFYDKTKNNHPTQRQCAEIEAEFMVKELESGYKWIYEEWNKDKTVSKAGELICTAYEKPDDMENQANIRADNAKTIYNIMVKK